MPIETYTTPDFLASAGIVATDSLADQVAAALPGPAPQLVSEPLIRYGASDVDLFVDLDFDGALSGGEQATLDDVISAHLGTPNDHVRDLVVVDGGTFVVTAADPAVDVIGTIPMNPGALAPLDVIKVRVQCEIATTNSGALLRVVEQPSGNTVAFASLPDTSGAFDIYEIQSFLDMSPGANTYSLEANLGTAAALSVRGSSLVFVESIVPLAPPIPQALIYGDWASEFGLTEGGAAGRSADWADRVNGISPFNVVAADQPLLVVGTAGVRPALRFEGGADWLGGGPSLLSTSTAVRAYFVSVRNGLTAASQTLLQCGGAGWTWSCNMSLGGGTGEPIVFATPAFNSNSDTNTTIPNTRRMYGHILNSTVAPALGTRGRYNRALTPFNTKTANGAFAGNFSVAVSFGNNGGLAVGYIGDIFRVIIVDNAITAAEELRLAWYLSSFYQVP